MFCKLYVCMKAYQNVRNIPGWLRTAATTTALDMVRKRKFIPLEADHLEMAMDDFVDNLIQKCLTDDMLHALYQKNSKWLEYVEMRYMLEMTFEEISRVTGVTPKAVRNSIERAKKFLFKKHFHMKLDTFYPIIIFLVKILIKKDM